MIDEPRRPRVAALALLSACSVDGAGATPRGATIALELVVRRDKRSSEACECQAPRGVLQAVQETFIFLTHASGKAKLALAHSFGVWQPLRIKLARFWAACDAAAAKTATDIKD